MRKLLLALALVSVGVGQIKAEEIPYRLYVQVKNTEQFRMYISGVGLGLVLANTDLSMDGKPMVFCQSDIALGPDNYISIIDKKIKSVDKAVKPNDPIELILLYGLKDLFPCKQS